MRLALRFTLVLLCLTSLAAYAADGNPSPDAAAKKPRFDISKETTYVTGPVRADGTIDYVAAINEELSKGITAKNNAAIPLLRAVQMLKPNEMQAHYAKVWKAMGEPEPRYDQAGPDPNLAGDILDNTLSGPWTAAKHPQAAAIIDSNKAELDLLIQASQRDQYYMPLVREREDDPLVGVLLPHLNLMRHMANVLKSRAMLCLGNEDMAGFERDATALIRLGRLLTHAPTLIENLVAIGMEAIGLDAIKIAASGGWLPEKDAEKILAAIRSAPPRRSVAAAFEGGERGFMLEFLQTAAVHGYAKAQQFLKELGGNNDIAAGPSLANNASKDWNAAMRSANAWYDRLADAGKKTTFPERLQAARDVMHDVEDLKSKIDGWKSAFAPIEDRLIVMVLPSVERCFTTETRIIANERLTETALALSAFRTKLGEYPPQLKLLAPAYFKSEPIDPFTEKPFIYKTAGTGYELKSAGPPNQPAQNRNTDMIIEASN